MKHQKAWDYLIRAFTLSKIKQEGPLQPDLPTCATSLCILIHSFHHLFLAHAGRQNITTLWITFSSTESALVLHWSWRRHQRRRWRKLLGMMEILLVFPQIMIILQISLLWSLQIGGGKGNIKAGSRRVCLCALLSGGRRQSCFTFQKWE